MIVLQVIINGLLLAGLYLLLAQGLNLIFGVMKVVNFAHGAVVALAGLAAFGVTERTGISPLLLVPVAFVVAGIAGLFLERLVIARIKSVGLQHEMATLVATFGLSYILINVAQAVWGSQVRKVPYMQTSLHLGEFRLDSALLITSGIAIILAGVLYWWLGKTALGKSVRATAQTEIGAEICGINTARIRMVAFGLGTALAGTAGVLVVLSRPVSPELSTTFTITSFVIIALGGFGNYAGAALGAVIVGVLEVFVGYTLGLSAQQAVPYILLLLIMFVRPSGLLPQKA